MPDLRDGHQPQLLIPGGTFRPGCWDWPLVSGRDAPAEDVEIGHLDELAAAYPAVGADLRAIASVRHVPQTTKSLASEVFAGPDQPEIGYLRRAAEGSQREHRS